MLLYPVHMDNAVYAYNSIWSNENIIERKTCMVDTSPGPGVNYTSGAVYNLRSPPLRAVLSQRMLTMRLHRPYLTDRILTPVITASSSESGLPIETDLTEGGPHEFEPEQQSADLEASPSIHGSGLVYSRAGHIPGAAYHAHVTWPTQERPLASHLKNKEYLYQLYNLLSACLPCEALLLQLPCQLPSLLVSFSIPFQLALAKQHHSCIAWFSKDMSDVRVGAVIDRVIRSSYTSTVFNSEDRRAL